MPQFLRPASTVSSATWSYVGPSFHGAIAEASADDATTYVIHTVGGSVTAAEVALSPGTDPSSSSDHIVYFRSYLDIVAPLAAPNELTVSLYEGATLIAEDTVSPASQTWETFSFTLAGAEADAITDYTDLRLVFDYSYGGLGGELWITQAYLEIPSAGSGTGGFDITLRAPARKTTDCHSRPAKGSSKFHNSEHSVFFQENWVSDTTEAHRYAKPTSRADAKGGRICAATGYWFPARLVVYVDGLAYGRPFAPRRG